MTKPVYLNQERKNQLKTEIFNQVSKKYRNSTAGKEVEKLKKIVIDLFLEAKSKTYAESDMDVLKRFGHTRTLESIRIKVEDDRITDPSYFEKQAGVELFFDPAVEIPEFDMKGSTYVTLEIFNDIKKLQDKTIELCKIEADIKCDITKLVSAYMARVNKYRTVGALLKAYPDMNEFVTIVIDAAPTEDEVLIEQFKKEAA